MQHEIVTNRRTLMVAHIKPASSVYGRSNRDLRPTRGSFTIRQCKNCGCSERYIEHFGRTECRHQSEGE